MKIWHEYDVSPKVDMISSFFQLSLSGGVILIWMNLDPDACTLCEIKKRKSNVNILDFYSLVTRCLGVIQSAQVLSCYNMRAGRFCNTLKYFDKMTTMSFNICNIILILRWWTVARKVFTQRLCHWAFPSQSTPTTPRRRSSPSSTTRRAASARKRRRRRSWPTWPQKIRDSWRHPGVSPYHHGG